MENEKYSCDLESGFCGIPTHGGLERDYDALQKPHEKPLHIVYFSDPVCSYCWNIEAYLRKLSLEYGQYFTCEERMGGLLETFGIKSYSDEVTDAEEMASMWDKISEKLRLPINGKIWLTDPLSSSYPPSIAFKAAQLQSEELALKLMRRLREALYVEVLNISKWNVIKEQAEAVGLNIEKLEADYSNGSAKKAFEEDLELTQKLKVDIFPTLIILNKKNQNYTLSAPSFYVQIEDGIKKMNPGAILNRYNRDVEWLLNHFGSSTLKEMSVLTELSYPACEDALDSLVDAGKAVRIRSPKGSLWRTK